jgi:hypothetical protein
METVIVAVVCIVLMITGGMTMSQGILSTADSARGGIVQTSQREEEIMRTNIEMVSVNLTSNDTLEVKVSNTGHTKLMSYDKWDVIMQYWGTDMTYRAQWLPYLAGSLESNKWTISSIVDLGTSGGELLDPEIINPGEMATIHCKVAPAVKPGSSGAITISTPNGVTVSRPFTLPE